MEIAFDSTLKDTRKKRLNVVNRAMIECHTFHVHLGFGIFLRHEGRLGRPPGGFHSTMLKDLRQSRHLTPSSSFYWVAQDWRFIPVFGG